MPRITLDERGCVGDRLWSVRTAENKIGSGKNTRRFAAVNGLLRLRAATDSGGSVTVSFPDGTTCPVDHPGAAKHLSAFIGQTLSFSRETSVSHFDDGPVSMIGTASVDSVAAEREASVDVRRFRANIVFESTEPNVEQTWLGRDVRLGGATLRVTMPSMRCAMIDMETADLPAQPGNLKAVGRVNDVVLGVVATVTQPGSVSIGDQAVPL
jgi:uncharacterized protein YcbX